MDALLLTSLILGGVNTAANIIEGVVLGGVKSDLAAAVVNAQAADTKATAANTKATATANELVSVKSDVDSKILSLTNAVTKTHDCVTALDKEQGNIVNTLRYMQPQYQQQPYQQSQYQQQPQIQQAQVTNQQLDQLMAKIQQLELENAKLMATLSVQQGNK